MAVAAPVLLALPVQVERDVARLNSLDRQPAAFNKTQEVPRVVRVLFDGPPAEVLCFEVFAQSCQPAVARLPLGDAELLLGEGTEKSMTSP